MKTGKKITGKNNEGKQESAGENTFSISSIVFKKPLT